MEEEQEVTDAYLKLNAEIQRLELNSEVGGRVRAGMSTGHTSLLSLLGCQWS